MNPTASVSLFKQAIALHLIRQRERLGLDHRQVSTRSGIPLGAVIKAEEQKHVSRDFLYQIVKWLFPQDERGEPLGVLRKLNYAQRGVRKQDKKMPDGQRAKASSRNC